MQINASPENSKTKEFIRIRIRRREGGRIERSIIV